MAQIQTQQYVDGEWVTRPSDVYRLMDRGKEAKKKDVSAQAVDQHDALRLGILSKTVHESSHVKYILPANIRQRRFNDVVFVGENVVHLKEALADGSLRHVGSKSDFRGKILAARVFGAPRETNANYGTTSTPTRGTPINRRDINVQRRSTSAEHADNLPQEIVVLTLDSRALLFLWAYQTPTGMVDFRHVTLRLPAGTSPFDRPGSFLAVDPKCRAIAVSALENQFILYKTKDINAWREEIGRNGLHASLVEDERVMEFTGRVLHMGFLAPDFSSGTQSDSHVILVFVVAHHGTTRITFYDWDTRYDLNTVRARAERVHVDLEDQNSSLFIPLSRSPTFLLVCDRHVATYRGLLTGTTNRFRSPVPDNALLAPGDTKTYPRWVQWSRVTRNHGYPKEALYIAREDGRVLYVEVGPNLPALWDAGQLPFTVDRAFASLDIDAYSLNHLQPDVLVAAGTSSDGYLFKVGSWLMDGINKPYQETNTVGLVEPIPNWAPISDSIVAASEGERANIFVSNGRAPHGAITELRRGYQARIDDWTGGMTGATGLWIVHQGSEEVNGGTDRLYHALVLVNMPPESLVFRVTRANGSWCEIEQLTEEDVQGDTIALAREETLSACMLSDKFTVQVTRTSARVLMRPTLAMVDSLDFADPVLAAATQNSFIAIAYHQEGSAVLQVFEIQPDGHLGSSECYTLPNDPTYIAIIVIGGAPYVFISFTNSTVGFGKIFPEGEEDFYLNTAHLKDGTNQPIVCDSAVLLSFADKCVALCGTREGVLVKFCLSDSGNEDGIAFTSTFSVRMGTTTVRVARSATDSTVAFASCGPDFCRIQPINQGRPRIDSVWFTDRHDDIYKQDQITAIDQLSRSREDDDVDQDLDGYFFAICGERLLLAQLDYDRGPRSILQESKTIPRRIPVTATPMKMMHAEMLRKIIVQSMVQVEKRPPPVHGYRTITSAIQVLDPETGEGIITEFPLSNYERVQSFVEWIWMDDQNRRHHFIFAGTSVAKVGGGESGRLYFLQVSKSGLKLKSRPWEHRHPVRCLTCTNDGLLYTTGVLLRFEKFSGERRKWEPVCEIELPSEPTCLSWVDNLVYVSTASSSYLCYRIQTQTLPDSTTGAETKTYFQRCSHDSRTRMLTHHTVVRFPFHEKGVSSLDKRLEGSGCSVVLLADKSCSITGLLQVASSPHRSEAYLLFEAHLPRSVIRLHRGDIRPPWRQTSTGILVDDIIGTCSDGTVYSFSIISEDVLALLKLIQNLIEIKEAHADKATIIRPRNIQAGTPKSSALLDMDHIDPTPDQLAVPAVRLRDVDPDYAHNLPVPKLCHVDADVLIRYFNAAQDYGNPVDHSHAARLFELIHNNTEDPQAIVLRIRDLAEEVGLGGSDDPREMYKDIGYWLAEVLMELL